MTPPVGYPDFLQEGQVVGDEEALAAMEESLHLKDPSFFFNFHRAGPFSNLIIVGQREEDVHGLVVDGLVARVDALEHLQHMLVLHVGEDELPVRAFYTPSPERIPFRRGEIRAVSLRNHGG